MTITLTRIAYASATPFYEYIIFVFVAFVNRCGSFFVKSFVIVKKNVPFCHISQALRARLRFDCLLHVACERAFTDLQSCFILFFGYFEESEIEVGEAERRSAVRAYDFSAFEVFYRPINRFKACRLRRVLFKAANYS